MEIDESYNTITAETSDQTRDKLILHNNNADQKGNEKTSTMIHLPRREFRKLMRKQRKKNARIEAAKARQLQEEEENSEGVTEATKNEERKRNAERILWEVRERQIDQANAEKKKRQEENERNKKIIQTVKSIKIPKPATEEEINNKDSIELITSPSVTSVQEDSSEKTDYGTEKDQVNCPFYLKTGACRYGDSCGRYHPYPEKSCTILIKNMYEGMPVQLADENDDDDLEYDEVEAEKHYFDFFEDVHTEFHHYGIIVQFKVCNNFQQHLRGNVYVQYSSEVEAELAIENIRGRWYAGKQLICDYCPVTKWKPAICGYYQRNQCPKGIQCNFLHVYKNPGGLYLDADRDFEDLPWKQSNSITATDNSSVSKSVKKESISVSSTNRHHKKNDRELNESFSHRNRRHDYWDQKPSDYEADNEAMKKKFVGDNRNYTRDGNESGNDSKQIVPGITNLMDH
ncbi:8740_t:CDS:10 [Funneliformis geosporum]|nr:8740_t:CDS:10 [Funneliformis geosporum]